MNENEIMIDGANVSGCGLNGVECSNNFKCADNPDCYYKQLQRIKAEYKKFSEYVPIAARLAKRFKTLEEAKGIDYDGILSEWIEENEELKNTLKEVEEIAEAQIFINDYCPITIIEKILAKIKEVENERQI